MTPQESDQLNQFLLQLTQAETGAKDLEADNAIKAAAERQPEALYLLVQRAMGLDLALKAAQVQLTKQQAEIDALQTKKPSGFLNPGSAYSWGQTPSANNLSSSPQAQSVNRNFPQPAPGYYQQPMNYAQTQPSSWGSGMLTSIATTAAGVVAGSLLYQGIQGMMGHHQNNNNFSDSGYNNNNNNNNSNSTDPSLQAYNEPSTNYQNDDSNNYMAGDDGASSTDTDVG